MCDALNITAAEFGELESAHWQQSQQFQQQEQEQTQQLSRGFDQQQPIETQISSEENTASISTSTTLRSLARKKFHDKFNQDCKSVPPGSILASFRIWRVAFIAAGGGALMALSGRLAAPAIMNTVLPLICASNTLGQVSLALSTVLSCFGVTSLEIIPGIMSSYGATVAGRRMLNRTAPLKEFSLRPLHLEADDGVLAKAAGAGAETTLVGFTDRWGWEGFEETSRRRERLRPLARLPA